MGKYVGSLRLVMAFDPNLATIILESRLDEFVSNVELIRRTYNCDISN